MSEDRRLIIGEANFGGTWFDVFAIPTPNLIKNSPESHTFKNIPERLKDDNNKDGEDKI